MSVRRAIRVAKKRHDGHFAIMRFTTNWRVMFGTPYGRDDIDQAFAGLTFADAAGAALAKEQIETHRVTQNRGKGRRHETQA